MTLCGPRNIESRCTFWRTVVLYNWRTSARLNGAAVLRPH